MIKFGYTILYVQDVTASITFYETAFGFERRFIAPDGTYAELVTGSTTLSFAAHNLAKTNLPNAYTESSLQQKAFGIEIGFTTQEVESTVNSALAAGAKLEAHAKTKPWGQTVAYVRDPDGFLIEICTPMQ